MSPTPTNSFGTEMPEVPDPAAEDAFQAQVDRVAAEKKRAREAPDVPWRTWWYNSGSKWYVVLGFLIGDVWLLDVGYLAGSLVLGIVALAVALYAEFLLYRYLYYVPAEEDDLQGPFRRSWFRPVEFGRWTEQGAALRSGGRVEAPEAGPDPKEFL
jgi:hypothetical protein